MPVHCTFMLVGIMLATSAASSGESQRSATSSIWLDGEQVAVRWSDGDSFEVSTGAHRRVRARLVGFNTLESYGPVHRWGRWTSKELYDIAKNSQAISKSRAWKCYRHRDKDGYGRLLVRCPQAALLLVGLGHAHVMAVEQPPSPALLEAQRAAQKARRGIWAKGVPAVIVTSVHSASEGKPAYNRLVDTQTGVSTTREHQTTYEICQQVCEGPAQARSCMVYVPHQQRYSLRPACLALP